MNHVIRLHCWRSRSETVPVTVATPQGKGCVQLKQESYQAWLTCGTPEAFERCLQDKWTAAGAVAAAVKVATVDLD